jgi:hypothetical protein
MAEIVTMCLPFSSSLLWLLEVPQIRRRLVLTGRHQHAVAAHEIGVLANRDFCCILRTVKLAPAPVCFSRPRSKTAGKSDAENIGNGDLRAHALDRPRPAHGIRPERFDASVTTGIWPARAAA